MYNGIDILNQIKKNNYFPIDTTQKEKIEDNILRKEFEKK